MHTEAINHDPAVTFFSNGIAATGRPSIGAWASYGLGSENHNLPAFVVMLSRGSGRPNCQPLYDRLWGSGFLPSQHQGCKFLSNADPVAYLSNPPGMDRSLRRMMIDEITALNQHKYQSYLDPEITTRIEQYELAFRMQAAVPELVDFSDESEATLDAYGPRVKIRGSFASNCLLARRLVERGVSLCAALSHGLGSARFAAKADSRPVSRHRSSLSRPRSRFEAMRFDGGYAGRLGGEFGRTIYSQGQLTHDNYGRDHHPRCFSLWMAGAGVKPGHVHGKPMISVTTSCRTPSTFMIFKRQSCICSVSIIIGSLTVSGRDFRLTDVHGNVVHDVLS